MVRVTNGCWVVIRGQLRGVYVIAGISDHMPMNDLTVGVHVLRRQ